MQHLEINLFILTAEADRVLCKLVMFLILDVRTKYTCHQESSVIHGWFVYLHK